jgi:hypothetical protein
MNNVHLNKLLLKSNNPISILNQGLTKEKINIKEGVVVGFLSLLSFKSYINFNLIEGEKNYDVISNTYYKKLFLLKRKLIHT